MIKTIKDIRNKKITVMGLGLNQGGLGITRFLAIANAKVLVTDLKTCDELHPSLEKLKDLNIKYVLGKHREEDFIHTDMIIKNPAIPNNSKFLQIARDHGIPIKTDLDIFFSICPSQQLIAVAGTKGKSTVSHLINEIFQKANIKTVLAGNMGISVFNILNQITPSTILILEISSWQLEGMKDFKFRANTAVLTNILPDHLDRYDSFKSYAKAEKMIFKYQKSNDNLIINWDNKETGKIKNDLKPVLYGFSTQKSLRMGSYLHKNDLIFNSGKNQISFGKISDLALSGVHNLENILAASTVAFIHKISTKIISQAISEFSGIPNRLELVRELKGIEFYNDTCATTPDATIAALQSLPEKPIILIVGGKNKKLSYKKMAISICKDKRLKKIILLRHPVYDVTTTLFSYLDTHCRKDKAIWAKNMIDAIDIAYQEAKNGYIILLSPAAASFGMFKNEFDRGNQFNEAVSRLS